MAEKKIGYCELCDANRHDATPHYSLWHLVKMDAHNKYGRECATHVCEDCLAKYNLEEY
jgi:hypothetical protein